MPFYRYQHILALFLACALLYSCKGDKASTTGPSAKAADAQAEAAGAPRTNVEELSLLVNVPYETDDVVWKEDTRSRKVVAVLHFSKRDADAIVAAASAKGTAEQVTVPSESWYPAELIAQSEMNGDEVLRGTAYAADEFYLEPYAAGRIVRVDQTDYFVLQLSVR